MKRTNVFATEDEAKELSELAKTARSTPVIAMSVGHGLSTGGFAGEAWDRVQKRTHELAKSHGLPEITGYYGIDLSNREFVQS